MKSGGSAMADLGLLWLRVITGAGLIYHGYGKVFGGMEGFTKAVASLGFPRPEVFAWAAALSEFAGGILLVAGMFTRPAALWVFITMSVAAFMVHKTDPLKAKELALAYWAATGALVFLGGGGLSLGAKIKARKVQPAK